MIPYHQEPEHVAPANRAARCQHVRMTGRRCGSPALRGQSYCYFHDNVHRPNGNYDLPTPEDATSLQYGVTMVIRMLIAGHVELKRCWTLLYALQIAHANLKNFSAERQQREVLCSCGKPASPRLAGNGNGSIDKTLAGVMKPLLPADSSKKDEPSAVNIEEEFVMERKIPEPICPARSDRPRMERVGGVWAPPLL